MTKSHTPEVQAHILMKYGKPVSQSKNVWAFGNLSNAHVNSTKTILTQEVVIPWPLMIVYYT